VMMKGMNKPPTISPKEWMSIHHFIKGMNEYPPFYQRNEWTSSILSKEWMNIQHFIKGMDEHPAFYQRNGWTSSILSKEWRNIQHFIKTLSSLTKAKSMHTISLYSTSKDTSRQTDWDIYHAISKINGSPKSKALVWYLLLHIRWQ